MKAKAIQTTIELSLAAIGLALAFHQILKATDSAKALCSGLSPDPVLASALLLEIVCYFIASFILFYILMYTIEKLGGVLSDNE